MTLYGFLLALLPHRARLRISPAYGFIAYQDPAARRRFARRIHGRLGTLAVGLLSFPWRTNPRKER